MDGRGNFGCMASGPLSIQGALSAARWPSLSRLAQDSRDHVPTKTSHLLSQLPIPNSRLNFHPLLPCPQSPSIVYYSFFLSCHFTSTCARIRFDKSPFSRAALARCHRAASKPPPASSSGFFLLPRSNGLGARAASFDSLSAIRCSPLPRPPSIHTIRAALVFLSIHATSCLPAPAIVIVRPARSRPCARFPGSARIGHLLGISASREKRTGRLSTPAAPPACLAAPNIWILLSRCSGSHSNRFRSCQYQALRFLLGPSQ